MAAIDAAALEPLEVLVKRAGWVVASHALDMLGGAYGRRVTVIAGKGNNGADGRVAAEVLRRRGVRCSVVDPGEPLPKADLVIDAAYGTGLRDPWPVPPQPPCPVLAVDIPTGVDGLTGEDLGSLAATRTVTFAALKPGLLFEPGASQSGSVMVADIGLDVDGSAAWLVDDADASAVIGQRAVTAHKWDRAVRVVAGSPGMTGACRLTAAAALRAGAGMVTVSTPGRAAAGFACPTEAVARPLPSTGWGAAVLEDLERHDVLAIGPGLGRDPATMAEVADVVMASPVPVVVDADGITALAERPEILAKAASPVIVTPHDGEFGRLAGGEVSADRLRSTRELAHGLGVIVLLKGATTVVAAPDGEARVIRSGSPRLATAGTGDVLTGVIAALAARAPALEAAAAGAHWHGRAAALGSEALVAGDLADLLGPAAEEMAAG